MGNEIESIRDMDIRLSLRLFKDQLNSYIISKDSKDIRELDRLTNLNRNPIFDTTNRVMYRHDKKSINLILIKENKNISSKERARLTKKDHIVPRCVATKYIFEELIDNPNMSIQEYEEILMKVGKYAEITADEHDLLRIYHKNNNNKYLSVEEYLNFTHYKELGIVLI